MSPIAQQYASSHLGRGLFQFGGPSAPANYRGFVGPQCRCYGTKCPLQSDPGKGGLLAAQADNEGCTAYNPLLASALAQVYTQNGKNWLPIDADWESCIGNKGFPRSLPGTNDPRGFDHCLALDTCRQVSQDFYGDIYDDTFSPSKWDTLSPWSCSKGTKSTDFEVQKNKKDCSTERPVSFPNSYPGSPQPNASWRTPLPIHWHGGSCVTELTSENYPHLIQTHPPVSSDT